MSIVELCLEVEGFLGRLREGDPSPEEQEKLLVAIDAIRFISASGQSYGFEDYRKGLDANAPPLVIAAFHTRRARRQWALMEKVGHGEEHRRGILRAGGATAWTSPEPGT
jgi:hypothetical protein